MASSPTSPSVSWGKMLGDGVKIVIGAAVIAAVASVAAPAIGDFWNNQLGGKDGITPAIAPETVASVEHFFQTAYEKTGYYLGLAWNEVHHFVSELFTNPETSHELAAPIQEATRNPYVQLAGGLGVTGVAAYGIGSWVERAGKSAQMPTPQAEKPRFSDTERLRRQIDTLRQAQLK